jgi:superfamily II DNA or RNA helicase/predicted transcriptional regulator
MNKNLIKDFSYPEQSDKNIQLKLFKKREFYYNLIEKREKMKTYNDIQNYRNSICKENFSMREQQALLSNLINPNTPYKGLLIMHGTGTGKSCTAISIAEQYKEQIKKYNTKIFILTSGPNTKETIKNELLFCTGETYLKNKEMLNQMTKEEREKERKIALYSALQDYKILSYKTFYKKILGEKIVEKQLSNDNKIKSSFKKNEEGDIEREIVVDRITNMNNSLLIIDEAHNLTGNEYGEALKHIIKKSENLTVILLTATPMKNLADDIVDLLNFIRPLDDQIIRDKIFTGDKNYTMTIKEGGIEYLKEKARGYVSFFRGNIPYTFAQKVDKGILSNGLLFTPVVKCFMEKFQYKRYLETSVLDDALDRASSGAANFVFPGLNKEKNDIMGYSSTDGLNTVINNLETNGMKLKELINKKLFNNKLESHVQDNFIYQTENKLISGYILKKEYLKYFSIKFYKAIKRLDKLFDNNSDKEPGIAFVYSNLVRAGGMEIFALALIQNGYLEYQEDPKNYDIKPDTIDYKTGKPFSYYKKNNKINEFKPATFILIIGGGEEGEEIPETKQKYIREKFNSIDNIQGVHIKLCLGSKVMNEGITLENIKEIHILDVHYNLNKVDQVIGRGIRQCKHQNSITDTNRFPKVNVYRYVVALLPENKKSNELTKKEKQNTKLSSDEILYQKAEEKYKLIKDVEYYLKEVAVDCALLLNANMFPEEVEKYKNCYYPTLENVKSGKKICPALCNFRDCTLKCDSNKLNDKYWDEKNNTYKNLKIDEVDMNTFNDKLAKFEIENIKSKIKDLFKFKPIYLYDEILVEIKKSFKKHQAELFNEYFLDQALEDMMPKNENDFNNFKDSIYDKFNRSGYVIQRDKYYIFQPFDENEDVTMFYRQNIDIKQPNLVSIKNYVKQNYKNFKIQKEENIENENKTINKIGYNFDNVLDYYTNRKENFIVGIIDKNKFQDVFKIRKSIENIKKRGIINPLSIGAVCTTMKEKQELADIITKINKIIKVLNYDEKTVKKTTKESLCDDLKEKLLFLEKYSTSKDNNKINYVIIPDNHKDYPFPYNLEDRVNYRINQINTFAKMTIKINVNKIKNTFELTFDNSNYLNNSKDKLIDLGCKLNNNKWTLILD